MDLFPDAMPVRLRSRACDLFLFADEDGVGVSLSTLRASPRASWEVRRVERHGVAYVLLHSTADGRHLDITPDPAPPGARGLRVVQGETLGVEWSVRLAGDGSRDVLVRHSVLGFLCPMGCGTGVGVRQRVNGRSSLLPRWSVEPVPVAPPPPVTPPSKAMEEALGGAGGNEPEPEPEPEPEAPVVQAMLRQLEKLHQGMETRRCKIRYHVRRLRDIELRARTGNYDSETPLRKAVEEIEELAVDIVQSYHIMKKEADDVSAAIEREGVTVPAPPEVLRARVEDSLTRSIRRRLLRRQAF